jgi:adenylate kinase
MAEETAMRQQIKSALSQCDDGFVLDGCPRFLDQAQWLRSAIGKYTIYCLAVDSSVAISRLLERGRPDDTHDIILRRVAEYKTMTRPILAAVHHGELDCGLHVIRVAGKTAYAVAMEILVLNGRR